MKVKQKLIFNTDTLTIIHGGRVWSSSTPPCGWAVMFTQQRRALLNGEG